MEHAKRVTQVFLLVAACLGVFGKVQAVTTGNELHDAARTGNVEKARDLIATAEWMINMPDRQGNTPLMIATLFGREEVVEILKEAGGMLEVESIIPEELIPSNPHNGFERVLLLPGRGFRDHQIDFTILEFDHDQGEPLTTEVDSDERLCAAACLGNNAQVRIFLGAGANINGVDCEGNTPLHCAAARGRTEVLNTLLQEGALNSVNLEGKTPLDCARENGHEECANLLHFVFVEGHTIAS